MSFKKILCIILSVTQLTYVQAQSFAPGACSHVPGSQTCIDTTPCKPLGSGQQACLSGAAIPAGALPLPQTCWKYSYEFACAGPVMANTCTPYENNPACAIVFSACTDKTPETGACTSWNYTYQCKTAEAVTGPQMACSSGLFDTSSMPTPSNPNANFGKAAVAMEIARQTQVYGKGGASTIFNGVPESCTKGYWGLRNCCNGTPGAQSNRSFLSTIAGSAAYSGVKYAGQQAVDLASPYVFDAMYSSGVFSDGLLTSIESFGNVLVTPTGAAVGTNMAANGVSLGAYGFTYGTGVFDAASALPGTMDLTAEVGLGAGNGYLTFNPYVFAAMLIIQYLQTLSQCDQSEMTFQMHKGANLVSYNNEVCEKSLLGSCTLYRDNYCSFNSVLAKIINIQGKTQLGMNVSDCQGLTVDQVGHINFKNIDFSEFTATMVQQAQKGLPTNIKGTYTPLIQNTVKGAAQTPSKGISYPPLTGP